MTPETPASSLARALWSPVTIRVAWELVLARVAVRADLLADARDHVLTTLPDDVNADEAERLCGLYVADYLSRTREGRYRRVSPDADVTLPIPRAWKGRLLAAADPLSDAIFRLHYGDGQPLEIVERHTGAYRTAIAAAQDGLREMVRNNADRDGMFGDALTDGRCDRILGFLANLAEPGCPSPVGLLTEAGLEHADRCPRCSRAVRLVRGGVIAAKDLIPPATEALRAEEKADLFALILHPDAMKHKKRLDRSLRGVGVPVGPDAWFVAAEKLGELVPLLEAVCEDATPARHHLRGARVTAAGRWSGMQLLGPAPVAALEAARARPWADVGPLCELPAPLPQPPKATAYWASAGLLGALTLAVAAWASRPPSPEPTTPLSAGMVRKDGAWEVRFDTLDLAVVDIISLDSSGRLSVVQRDLRAAKGALATGEGDFSARVPGEGAAIIASPEGIADLDALVDASDDATEPLDALRRKVREAGVGADVALSPRRN